MKGATSIELSEMERVEVMLVEDRVIFTLKFSISVWFLVCRIIKFVVEYMVLVQCYLEQWREKKCIG